MLTLSQSASSLATLKDASLTNQNHNAKLVATAMRSTQRVSATLTLKPLRNAASTEPETVLAPSVSLDFTSSREDVRNPTFWAASRRTPLELALTVPQVLFFLCRFLSESWLLR